MMWTPIEVALPPFTESVEWCRQAPGLGSTVGQSRPFVAAWSEFRPEFNVAGLVWRPLDVRLREVGLIR